MLSVLIEGLDERLELEVAACDASADRDLEQILAEFRDGQIHLVERRDGFMRQGATGAISKVALNAIDRFGDTAETLHRFAREWRF